MPCLICKAKTKTSNIEYKELPVKKATKRKIPVKPERKTIGEVSNSSGSENVDDLHQIEEDTTDESKESESNVTVEH